MFEEPKKKFSIREGLDKVVLVCATLLVGICGVGVYLGVF